MNYESLIDIGWLFQKQKFNKGPEPDNLIPPIIDHGRQEAASITGGYVYRGKTLTELSGHYIYADYELGNVWALLQENGRLISQRRILKKRGIVSFAEDSDGEIYIVTARKIFKLSHGSRASRASLGI